MRAPRSRPPLQSRWNAAAHSATVCAPHAWKPDEQRTRTRASRGPGRAVSCRARRIAAAAVVVPVLLLPAQRLLRAAPGARGDGCLQRYRGGVPARPDRLFRRPWRGPGRVHAAVHLHRGVPDHAAAAAGLRLAGEPFRPARVPAGDLWFLHRHPAVVLRHVRQRRGRARAGLHPLDHGVQSVRRSRVLELHGRRLQQRRGEEVLRLHRRGRHHRRVRRAGADAHPGRTRRDSQHDAGLGSAAEPVRGVHPAAAALRRGARGGARRGQRRAADGGRGAGWR